MFEKDTIIKKVNSVVLTCETNNGVANIIMIPKSNATMELSSTYDMFGVSKEATISFEYENMIIVNN